MKKYVVFTKKTVAVTCIILMLSLLVISRYSDAKSMTVKNGETHRKRADFLANIGCLIVDQSADIKKIEIPDSFSDVFKTYNDLQKKAGFDLSEFKGETVTVYTYKVKSFKPLKGQSNISANLIVYNGRIIGGDVSSAEINGKMYPLKR